MRVSLECFVQHVEYLRFRENLEYWQFVKWAKLKNLEFFAMFKFDFSEIPPPKKLKNLEFFAMFKFDFSKIPPPKLKNLEFFAMFKFDFSEIPPQIEKLRIFCYVQI